MSESNINQEVFEIKVNSLMEFMSDLNYLQDSLASLASRIKMAQLLGDEEEQDKLESESEIMVGILDFKMKELGKVLVK